MRSWFTSNREQIHMGRDDDRAMATNRFSRQNRDAGLRRISAITRWTLAGALAGTGLFAGLASHSALGSTAAGATTPADPAAPRAGSAVATRPDDAGNWFNQAPAPQPVTVLPSPSNGATSIVSGAS
jgi:hypothetical protein